MSRTATPTPTPLQANVSRVVRTLLAAKDVEQSDLAEGIGLAESVISKRMNGSSKWTPDEIAAMASYFGVPEQMFFADAGTLVQAVDVAAMERFRSRCGSLVAQPTLPGFDGGVWVAAAPRLAVSELVAA